MSEYADGFDDGKGEKFDELMVEIVALRQRLQTETQLLLDGNKIASKAHREEVAALRNQLEKKAWFSAYEKKEWVGLTGTEINHIFAKNVGYPERMMKDVENLLKEKNT
jgi:hypothetical protein